MSEYRYRAVILTQNVDNEEVSPEKAQFPSAVVFKC